MTVGVFLICSGEITEGWECCFELVSWININRSWWKRSKTKQTSSPQTSDDDDSDGHIVASQEGPDLPWKESPSFCKVKSPTDCECEHSDDKWCIGWTSESGMMRKAVKVSQHSVESEKTNNSPTTMQCPIAYYTNLSSSLFFPKCKGSTKSLILSNTNEHPMKNSNICVVNGEICHTKFTKPVIAVRKCRMAVQMHNHQKKGQYSLSNCSARPYDVPKRTVKEKN